MSSSDSNKVKTNWDVFTPQIINLHLQGKSTSEIIEVLNKENSNIKLPSSADRRIRHIVKYHKDSTKKINEENIKNNNKILIFDIETAPMKGYFWSKWQNGISDNMIIHDWYMLSWAAKWLFEDDVYSDKMTQEELSNKDDKRISKSLWDLIDEANIIIAHNGVKFDIKRMKTRFLQHGFSRPSPYQVIDTLLHFRKNFALASNRLDYIAENFFGIKGKMETPKNLWNMVLEGNEEMYKLMDEYCKQDVKVLEDVYLNIRGWISPHPNLSMYAVTEESCCPVCSSEKKELTKTTYDTYVNSYEAYRCLNCHHIYRERKSKTSISKNTNVKVSVPK